MEKFKKVTPEYTGGNIYCFTGQLNTGNLKTQRYFLASSDNYDVVIVDADPDTAEREYPDEDPVWYPEWQEEHLVKHLPPYECLRFFKSMLRWIIKYSPSGNYQQYDMEELLKELKLIKHTSDWR